MRQHLAVVNHQSAACYTGPRIPKWRELLGCDVASRRRPRILKWRESVGCELLCLDTFINRIARPLKGGTEENTSVDQIGNGRLSRHAERTDAQHE